MVRTDGWFAILSTWDKWDHVAKEMNKISNEDAAFSMRRRLGPHHTTEQTRQETKLFRIGQYARWCIVKDLYAEYRDEMANTNGVPAHETCKNILEKIFTADLDQALRETLNDNE